MGNDEHHMALPKLYGAPAYARPAAPVVATPEAVRSGRPAARDIPDRGGARALLRAPGAGLRRRRRGRPRRDIRRRRSRGLADAARPALPPRLDHVAHPRRRRELLGGLTPPAPASSDRSWGSSSIGQSGGLISRWFQVRVLAPLPPRCPRPGLVARRVQRVPDATTAHREAGEPHEAGSSTGDGTHGVLVARPGRPGPAQPRRRPDDDPGPPRHRARHGRPDAQRRHRQPRASGPTVRGAARRPTPAIAGRGPGAAGGRRVRCPGRPGSRPQRPARRPARQRGWRLRIRQRCRDRLRSAALTARTSRSRADPARRPSGSGPRTARATGARTDDRPPVAGSTGADEPR